MLQHVQPFWLVLRYVWTSLAQAPQLFTVSFAVQNAWRQGPQQGELRQRSRGAASSPEPPPSEDHVDIRFLQTMISGIPLVCHLLRNSFSFLSQYIHKEPIKITFFIRDLRRLQIRFLQTVSMPFLTKRYKTDGAYLELMQGRLLRKQGRSVVSFAFGLSFK